MEVTEVQFLGIILILILTIIVADQYNKVRAGTLPHQIRESFERNILEAVIIAIIVIPITIILQDRINPLDIILSAVIASLATPTAVNLKRRYLD